MAYDRTLERGGLPPDDDSIPRFAYFGDHWIERHKELLRSSGDDASRWRCHVRPAFGDLRPAQVDAAAIRKFVEAKLKEGLDLTTVGHCVRLVSRIFGDLIERPRETGASVNSVKALPKSTRRLYKSRHDPKKVPFIEALQVVEGIATKLAEPFATMYATGVYAWLRTGEILGLSVEDVDLAGRRLQIRNQVQFGRLGPLKDEDAGTVPIQDALLPRLEAQLARVGRRVGPLFPTTRANGGGHKRAPSKYVSIHTLHDRFAEACKAVGRQDVLDWEMPWYQSTRHTGASLWVMHGGDIAKLAVWMGHSTTWVTERYAHVRPGIYSHEDLGRLSIDSRLTPTAVTTPAEKRQKTTLIQ